MFPLVNVLLGFRLLAFVLFLPLALPILAAVLFCIVRPCLWLNRGVMTMVVFFNVNFHISIGLFVFAVSMAPIATLHVISSWMIFIP